MLFSFPLIVPCKPREERRAPEPPRYSLPSHQQAQRKPGSRGGQDAPLPPPQLEIQTIHSHAGKQRHFDGHSMRADLNHQQ